MEMMWLVKIVYRSFCGWDDSTSKLCWRGWIYLC